MVKVLLNAFLWLPYLIIKNCLSGFEPIQLVTLAGEALSQADGRGPSIIGLPEKTINGKKTLCLSVFQQLIDLSKIEFEFNCVDFITFNILQF